MQTIEQVYQSIGRRVVAIAAEGGSIDFAAKKKGGAGKKNCKKGWSCGYSCISKSKSCKNGLTGQPATYADWLAKQSSGSRPNGEAEAKPKPSAEAKPKKEGTPEEVPPLDRGDFDEFSTSKSAGNDRIEVYSVKSVDAQFLPDYDDKLIEGESVYIHELAFKVNGKLSAGSAQNPVTTLKTVVSSFRTHVQSMPDGAIVSNIPWEGDGLGPRRASFYRRLGFGEVEDVKIFEDEPPIRAQYGVVKSGKIVPITSKELKERILKELKQEDEE